MTDPLVMISGIANDARVWDAMPAGQVAMPMGDSITAMADDVLASAPPRFALAGHSMGGYVALAMIARAPERITRLALLATSAAPDDEDQRSVRRNMMEAARADFTAVAHTLRRAQIGPARRDDADLAATIDAMTARVGLDNFLRQQTAARDRPDARGQLSAIAVPTLILCGTDDRIIAPARSRELAAGIAGARLVMIPGCGHQPQLEATATTRDALDDWLEGV